jgi:hypothetical protein
LFVVPECRQGRGIRASSRPARRPLLADHESCTSGRRRPCAAPHKRPLAGRLDVRARPTASGLRWGASFASGGSAALRHEKTSCDAVCFEVSGLKSAWKGFDHAKESKCWEIQPCQDYDATTAVPISPQNLVIENVASGWFVIESPQLVV